MWEALLQLGKEMRQLGEVRQVSTARLLYEMSVKQTVVVDTVENHLGDHLLNMTMRKFLD